MDVILLADVEKVGLRGEVVSVTRGYMRNYLGPRRLAEQATPARVAEPERRDAQRARHEAKTFEQAQEVAEALGKAVLRFEVNAGPKGTLFGSVTATDVADELWRTQKIRVDRRKINLPDPIKRVGRYEIPVEIFTDVQVDVWTEVAPLGGQLPPEGEEPEAPEEAVEPDGGAEEAEALEAPGPEAVMAPGAEAVGAGEAPPEEQAEGEVEAGEPETRPKPE
jgi:large subunit ribosomal protein L9